MKLARLARKLFLLVAATVIGYGLAVAQTTDAPNAEHKPPDILENVKFRNLGPAAGGGRVAAVAGIPGDPNVYYVGAAGGGVWKTSDAGLTWKAVFEKQATASIGAIAVAPSNPNLVWVGTGEANPRNDVITGKGVYFSPDGGASWKFMGLGNAGQISQIVVHPTNPEVVYVGVLGHAWGANAERGVFRTLDGGKTWQKVLYVDERTGVSDLVMDPSNPLVLFAGMWEFVRYPWMLISGGEQSGIYRSLDGGATWKKLTEGLPKGPVGRIGLAIAPTNGNHVYALIEAKKGALWESTDLGEHWKLVSSDPRYIVRGFYFTTLHVAPDKENHIYFLSYQMLESHDGGKTAQVIAKAVHVDHHAFWIDPRNPGRMINGNDGGAYLSTDAGKTWRYLNNIPIEQFYMVATDDGRPYLLCGGLQDNYGWCGPSNSLTQGGIVGADWWTVVSGDGEYVVPGGGGSKVIYAESQNGYLTRLDRVTGTAEALRPYLHGVNDMPPKDLKYRFNWTSPIAVASSDWKTLYLGGNVVFKSTDAGQTWTTISPDLTRNDKTKQLSSGGPVELDMSGAETFDTILSLALSALDPQVIWAGTDDGLVQVTRDGGKSWANVTPRGAPEWGRVYQVEVSPFAAGTAYIAIDYHEVENNKPYVFKTHDFGKTWTAIADGLPGNDPARVVRENPNRKGMLVVGTDTGLFYSYDEGAHWMAVKSNFPTAPIYDIKFHKATHDLIVATHGRGLFVLDDITPLEETTPQVLAEDFHLYTTQPGVKWRPWTGGKHGFSARNDFAAPNPPTGVVISYYLAKAIEPAGEQASGATKAGGGEPAKQQAQKAPPAGGEAVREQEAGREREQQPEAERPEGRGGPVKIVVSDGSGQVVRTLQGAGKQGINRVTWDLRYDAEVRVTSARTEDEEEEEQYHRGPAALPGTYRVAVTAAGKTTSTEAEVEADPRMPFDVEAGRVQLRQALEVRDWLNAMNESLNRIDSLKSQLAALQRRLGGKEAETTGIRKSNYEAVVEQARALQSKLSAVQEKVYNVAAAGDPFAGVHHLARANDRLYSVYRRVSAPYNQAPSPLVMEDVAAARKELDAYLAEFNGLLKTEVAAFNRLAQEKGAGGVFAGEPLEIKP